MERLLCDAVKIGHGDEGLLALQVMYCFIVLPKYHTYFVWRTRGGKNGGEGAVT